MERLNEINKVQSFFFFHKKNFFLTSIRNFLSEKLFLPVTIKIIFVWKTCGFF